MFSDAFTVLRSPPKLRGREDRGICNSMLGKLPMKIMKLALLGTVALAAVSVNVRADDLADLKSQIEALNSRISHLAARSCSGSSGWLSASFSI